MWLHVCCCQESNYIKKVDGIFYICATSWLESLALSLNLLNLPTIQTWFFISASARLAVLWQALYSYVYMLWLQAHVLTFLCLSLAVVSCPSLTPLLLTTITPGTLSSANVSGDRDAFRRFVPNCANGCLSLPVRRGRIPLFSQDFLWIGSSLFCCAHPVCELKTN